MANDFALEELRREGLALDSLGRCYPLRRRPYNWKDKGKIHGESLNRTPEYNSWYAMKHRCLYRKAKEYKNYGGRGISICRRWVNSYLYFLKDMGRKSSSFHSLERIDNNLGYFKGNCRWATHKEQMDNRRNTVIVSWNGKTQTLNNWAKELRIKRHTLYCRLFERKMPINIAFTKELNSHTK